MASHGKVLDLLDDRYLELQDVLGNVEPLPTLVPYRQYTQNVLVYRMDTSHDIFMGLIQDFTFRRAHETRKELWTWLVQWEVDNMQQPSSPKKVRLNAQQENASSKAPATPRKSSALTIFERRTLDGALMLEEDMLRILIDVVQVGSSLVPNFIEFLYRWIDYYEGDGKALKAALRWEIPSLWDFEYHPLVLPRDKEKDDNAASGSDAQRGGEREERARSVSASKAAELRQSSPTKKMHARPKPDLAAIELQTFYTEESERLQYREVKFGMQPPRLEQPLPPLINIPRDVRKRTKYYAACFKSRQRALYLLLEAGVTMRQINNYQKLQSVHPKETPETGDGNGLRNYQKDAKYAQAHFELKEKQAKQREITISNELAVEAQLAATHAMPDGAAGLPLIPPTPSYARKSDMAVAMMQKIKQTRAKNDDGKITIVPRPLVGLLKSKIFEGAHKAPELMPLRDSSAEHEWYLARNTRGCTLLPRPGELGEHDREDDDQDTEMMHYSSRDDDADEGGDEEDDKNRTTAAALPVSAPSLPHPALPMSLPRQPSTTTVNSLGGLGSWFSSAIVHTQPAPSLDHSTPPNIAAYMQNLNTEQASRLLPLLSPQARQAASSRLQESLCVPNTVPQGLPSSNVVPGAPLHAALGPGSHGRQAEARIVSGQTTSPTPRLVSGSLTLPKQRAPILYQSNPQAVPPQQPAPVGQPQHLTTQANRSISPYALSPTTAQSLATDPQPPIPMPPSFDPNIFLRLRRQQEAAESTATTGNSLQSMTSSSPGERLVLYPSFTVASELGHDFPAERQQMQPQTHLQTAFSQHAPVPHIVNNPSLPSPSTSTSTQLPLSAAMLPPPRLGITRNTPSPHPLSLSPQTPSPLHTLAPHILATSPFVAPSLDTRPPIQIYLPKILVPGNGIGPVGTRMGDGGCIETDALMLGHEDASTGTLVLTKAILLPVGVWENTLRKVRTGRWSVVETYACPSSHADGAEGKGKGRVDKQGKGCHEAVYEKLALAYGMMSSKPGAREKEVTKRWRTSRGPMTSSDRGAVWEGWGAYVDRGIGMSRIEREDAIKSETGAAPGIQEACAEGCGPYAERDEAARRKREMDELMDEDEDEDVDG